MGNLKAPYIYLQIQNLKKQTQEENLELVMQKKEQIELKDLKLVRQIVKKKALDWSLLQEILMEKLQKAKI